MSRDLDALVASLTLDEKAALTAGRDNWATAPVERAGIPAVRVTDGPNGARGSSVLGAGEATAVCIPCGSALGATWNPELIERLGALLGEEALTKGCRVLLAPTLNLHRSPLAGRNFECFSEDPLLAGRAAAAYVRGVQSRDVATTPKHLAGNEAELDRYTMSSVIDERALRELYLVPFELAVREGGALGVMTAYNRLNGGYCTEDEALLAGILRGEWGFEGFVVSDWFGLASTDAARRAPGSTSRCPGPGRVYGPALADAVRAGDGRRGARSTPRSAACSACSTASARSTTTPRRPSAPRTGPSTARSRARPRPTSFVLLRNDGLLPLDAGGAALARRDRPQRRPRAGHGRRLGQAARALLRHAARRRCASALPERRDPPRARLRHRPHGARAARRAGGSRSTAPTERRAERDAGLLLFDAADRPPRPAASRARAPSSRPAETGRAHVHAAPGRAARGCSSAARSCSTASRTRRRAARR